MTIGKYRTKMRWRMDNYNPYYLTQFHLPVHAGVFVEPLPRRAGIQIIDHAMPVDPVNSARPVMLPRLAIPLILLLALWLVGGVRPARGEAMLELFCKHGYTVHDCGDDYFAVNREAEKRLKRKFFSP